MIEVRDITKVYGRGRKRVVALSHVSFTLQDRGMVFIVGKSGCGKSTLLNMIGGCDKLTAGDIVMDGNKFSDFHEHDYDNFRNDYVGFIFQDYCLLEGLTVEENVALALDLKGERNDKAVKEALEKVGLSDCAARRPSELSGGQKQRVAIARTLVKNPKLILADEPTGNLDEKSTHIILDILKELSETTLVVIVSHNRLDAETYADRILELSDGRIVGDISRNPASCELSFRGRDIVMQKGTVFTDMDLARINAKFSWGGVYLKQTDDKFLPTPPIVGSGGKREFASHKLSSRGRKILFAMFAKKRIIGTIVTALTIVFLMIVMGVCQFFTQFDATAETARIMEEHSGTVFAMRKGYLDRDDPSATLDTTRLLHVPEEDIAAFREAGYKGNIFPLYNVSVLANEGQGTIWSLQTYQTVNDSQNYKQFYCQTGLGVLQVTEDYLIERYGVDGKLNVLSGEIKEEGDEVILTDYLADSIYTYHRERRPTPAEFAASGDKYYKITNGKMFNSRYRVSAVIETGYKERYASLIEGMQKGEKLSDIDSDLLVQFYNELNDGLNLAYTVAPDFKEVYDAENDRNFAYFGEAIAETEGSSAPLSTGYFYRDKSLKDDEIRIRSDIYAKIIGRELEPEDQEAAKGKKIKLKFSYLYEDAPYLEREFTVAGLFTANGGNSFFCSYDVLKELFPQAVYPYALYFDDMQGATEIYELGTELGYAVQSPLFSAMYSVSKYASVFVEFFDIIIFVLYALVAITLMAFAAGSVKKCMYEIGVLRAMGAKTHDLVIVFVLQMVLVSIAVCLLAGLGLWLGADVCNAVLAEGFAAVTKNAVMAELQFINFSWTTVFIDAGVMFGLIILCAAVPILLLRSIKPREIIRAKE